MGRCGVNLEMQLFTRLEYRALYVRDVREKAHTAFCQTNLILHGRFHLVRAEARRAQAWVSTVCKLKSDYGRILTEWISYGIACCTLNSSDEVASESSEAAGQIILNHTCLKISDPDRSLRFYREVLGFQEVMTWK